MITVTRRYSRDESIKSGHCNQEKQDDSTTTSRCTDRISQMILQDNSIWSGAENIVKDSFNYEVSDA